MVYTHLLSLIQRNGLKAIDSKGFAEYARRNPGIGRIQLIHMGKDAAGRNRFKGWICQGALSETGLNTR